MWWVLVLVVVALLGLAGVWALWLRNRETDEDEEPFISLVGLLSHHRQLSDYEIQQAALRAFGHELLLEEGEDVAEAIVSEDELGVHMIFCEEAILLVHDHPGSYVEHPEEFAQRVSDLRVADAVRRHQAWFSADVVHVNKEFSDMAEQVRWAFRQAARLFSELVDHRCLAIVIPETGWVIPVTEEVLQALEAEDPLRALKESCPLPVVPVSADDPLMKQAVEQARRTWPEFVRAFELRQGKDFGVKAPVRYRDREEFIWLEVTALEGDYIYGTLANDPHDLGPLKFGSRVRVSVQELNDWVYFTPQGELRGGYTIEIIRHIQQQRRTQHEADSES